MSNPIDTKKLRELARRYANDDAREDLDAEKWGEAMPPWDVLALLDAYERMQRLEQYVVDLANKKIDAKDAEIERLKANAPSRWKERHDEQHGEAIKLRELLELAMSKWVSLSGNRVWGAQEVEDRRRILKALGPEATARVLADYTGVPVGSGRKA